MATLAPTMRLRPYLLVGCFAVGIGRAQVAHGGFWTERLDALLRPDARAGTLGPVGARLWATRLLPLPGMRGDVHYIHHTKALRDPLQVSLETLDGAPVLLALAGQRWAPTHSEVDYTVAGGGSVRERRWITAEDVFVSELTCRGLPALRMRWRSPLATRSLGVDRQRPVALGQGHVPLATSPLLRLGAADAPVWMEGEAFQRQRGSTGVDQKAAASGGEVLGAEFGSRRGDHATWRFVQADHAPATAFVRYARKTPGSARVRVSVANGSAAGVEVELTPTGGWGEQPDHFALARVPLGELAQAVFELRVEVLEDGGNVNIDGVFVVPSDAVDFTPPPTQTWRQLDPLRGGLIVGGPAVDLDGVHCGPELDVDGVRFVLPGGGRGRAEEPGTTLRIDATDEWVHVLALPHVDDATLRLGDGPPRPLGPRQRELASHVVSVFARGHVTDLRVAGAVLLGVTIERPPTGGSDLRVGGATFHGVQTAIVAGVHRVDAAREIPASGKEPARAFATIEFSGGRPPGEATTAALGGDDPFAAHRAAMVAWYAANVPRLTCADRSLQELWTYRAFLLRHNLATPAAGFLPAGPVFYEGRHGSWYPRVITFSTPHIVAEARWLADPTLWQANVRAHLRNVQAGEDLPNVLVDWRGFRYTNWIAAAVVEACKARGDRAALAELLPPLAANLRFLVTRFDPDGDGLLAPGDHYTTGMEFQPSFWFHVGYDNSKPQTELERPDFNAYAYGNAAALAEGARWLGDAATTEAMTGIATRIRAAVLARLWHRDDGFFYSVREADDDPARCAEVIGLYPFRFGLVPAEDTYARALAQLFDPARFWARFGVTSCSRQVPVFSAAVQQWPGPGGVIQPCMWNGPVWPHATSLVADALARVARSGWPAARALRVEAHLGELMRAFAAFHREGGGSGPLLLREYGDADLGRNWGCADYLHSTFQDLVVCHWAGLVPRFDDVLEVRPLDLGLGDLRLEDVPYHGHRLDIALAGEDVTVRVDGKEVARAKARTGVEVPLR